jgi:phenylalanyl-tRNA synthetase beta chain
MRRPCFRLCVGLGVCARGGGGGLPVLNCISSPPCIPSFVQTLTMALCSREDNFDRLLLSDPGNLAVVLANPKTEEFQIGRTSVIPGLLKSLASNRAASTKDGLKLFEITDVMLLDAKSDVGARNERRLAALYTGPTAGFEVIHGLVNRIMLLLEVPPRPFAWEAPPAAKGGSGGGSDAAASTKDARLGTFGRGGLRYFIEHDASVPSYFPGRGARVVLEHDSGRTLTVGHLGVLHPKVLANFELVSPVSVVEISLHPLL